MKYERIFFGNYLSQIERTLECCPISMRIKFQLAPDKPPDVSFRIALIPNEFQAYIFVSQLFIILTRPASMFKLILNNSFLLQLLQISILIINVELFNKLDCVLAF